ncbi:hypothetical protein ASZ78_013450 [Callipepla squamata]|uniref:Glycosyltransferase 2-like domain-containing protein n=1 Tax=Callipepla squamata TaxID=9009 RepID=A0A226N8Z0_CALSU|nr:hypothetical protein ASZ78_013450 [Callipepla squamata]
MAVARKIKTLLTVNILVFVGIILFSVYCRIQDRSQELVQIVRSSDRRVRSRGAKVGSLADRESILQRLDHLEEVVYNQLNGLAKPMGLVEGPGGLGQGGMAATLRDDSHESETKYEEYGYNAQLSDRISLDRSIPDYRPKKTETGTIQARKGRKASHTPLAEKGNSLWITGIAGLKVLYIWAFSMAGVTESFLRCKQMTYPDDLPQISVVFIFVNEALSVILRSVHSVVNHTPSHLLKEIILVDDNSDNVELKFNLDQYVNKRYPGLVKIVRNNKREGLIRARIQGWKAATSPVVGFFDAHVEFNIGCSSEKSRSGLAAKQLIFTLQQALSYAGSALAVGCRSVPPGAHRDADRDVRVEPALTRIKEDRKRIILPAIDNIKYNTFEVQQYANAAHGYNWGLWCMYIIPPQDWLDKGDESAPIRTPAMIGCSFVVDREYFGEIGLLDPGMEVYGGENIELGMRDVIEKQLNTFKVCHVHNSWPGLESR